MRHVLTLFDLSTAEIERVFAVASDLKEKYQRGIREPLFPGRTMGMLFAKPSMRTRVSFETAMIHLGGGSLFLGKEVGWGDRESIIDFSKVLSQFIDVIVCRANSHASVEQLAEHCAIPVINGLTDYAHPCQVLADLFTVREIFGGLEGTKIAFIGDANNVSRSLLLGCAMLGVNFSIASPSGYQFEPEYVQRVRRAFPNLNFVETHDPFAAVERASVVYTDVWASMGQEGEHDERVKAFASFQVNRKLMDAAGKEARFMHCLPARRGEEVTDEIMDSTRSIVVPQAANRLHAQKGLLAWLLGANA